MSSDCSSDDSQEIKKNMLNRLTNSSVTKNPQNEKQISVQQPQDEEQKKQDNNFQGNKEEKQEEIIQKNDEEQQDNVNNSQQQQEQQQSKSGSQSQIQQNDQNGENLQESQQQPVQSKWKQEALQQKKKKNSSSDNDSYSDSDSDNNNKKKSSLENLRNRLMNKDGNQNQEQDKQVDSNNNQKKEQQQQQENQKQEHQQEEKQEKKQVFSFQVRNTDNNNQQDQIQRREANDWNQELGHDVSENQSYNQSGSHRYRSQRGRGQQQLGGQGRGFQKNYMGQQYGSNQNGDFRQQGQRFRQNYDRQNSRSVSRGSSQSPFKYGTNQERQQNIQNIGTHFRQQESYQNNQDGSQRKNVRQESYQNYQGGGLRGDRGNSRREYYDSKGQQGYQNKYNNYNNNDQYEVRNQNNNMRQNNYNNNNQNSYQQQNIQARQQNQILDSDEDLNVQTKDTDLRQIKSDYIMKFNFQGVEIALILGGIDVFQFQDSFLINPIQKNTNNYSTYEQILRKEITDFKQQIFNLFNKKPYFVDGVFNEYKLFNISTPPDSDLKFSNIFNVVSDNKLATTIRLYKSALKHNAQKTYYKNVCIPLLIADYQNQEFNNQEYIKQIFQEQINGLKELINAQNIYPNQQQYKNCLERAWFVIQDYEHYKICGEIFYQNLVQNMKLSLSDKKQIQ